MFISHSVLVLVGGERNIRSSITVSLDTQDIHSIESMAEARGIGFSAMASILFTQGRARLAELESRHTTAMENKPPADKGDTKPKSIPRKAPNNRAFRHKKNRNIEPT